ncbi:tetratricopeptide repeat protein [Streptomyces sp. HPF1205]|uniref:tetratricopeptide repeat protein n=1 Tax=Streptomyces sp. HPF1205 TaxID=2873262 RepID=UPI0027DFE153|nr:tetratricopeptide repeat protein [Streptomyces sp. HPF1205]
MVAVEGPGERGSGYVIGPRLVLTSAHVVPSAERIEVFRPGDEVMCRATVVWRGTPGGRDDAALLSVTDPAWVPPEDAGPGWGRLVTDRPGTPCHLAGSPDVVQRPGRPRELWQATGTLNPLSGRAGNRHVVTVHEVPAPTADGTSPWSGLSGAAVFSDGLLVGVVAADLDGFGHAGLGVVPAYVLHHDPAFRAALAEHGAGRDGGEALEPVEWRQLADTGDTRPTAGGLLASPAVLLRARRAVVPFRGREDLLSRMRAWCGEPGFGAWLVHGPAGQGKTRLAHQLATELGQGTPRWATLWLRPDAPAADLAVLASAAVPTLVVVDYAETRPRQLSALLRALGRNEGAVQVKLVLLARTAEDWWDDIRADSFEAEELLDGAPVTALKPLEPEAGDREAAYRAAADGFAAGLRRVRGWQDHPWPALAANLPVPALGGPALASALTLHMTALADLLDAATGTDRVGTDPGDPAPDDPAERRTPDGPGSDGPGSGGPGPGPGGRPGPDDPAPGGETPPADPDAQAARAAGTETVEDRLLVHERRYWTAVAAAHHLHPQLTMNTLADALAAAFLCGADDTDEADALLARVPDLSDQPRDRRGAVRAWIRALYPPDDARVWDGLQPDRLAERFIGRHLHRRPRLPESLLPGTGPAQAVRLLTVLTRAAAQPDLRDRLGPDLTALCAAHPGRLAAAAVEVATRTENPKPLVEALRRISDDPATPGSLLQDLADRLPHSSHNLADVAAQLLLRLVRHHRGRAGGPTRSAAYARALNGASYRLGALRRYEEGLEASREAVAIWRELCEVHSPEAYEDRTHEDRAYEDRAHEDRAHEDRAYEDRAYEDAAHEDRAHLGESVNALSLRLAALGQHEEALTAIREAVAIRRRLAAERPDLYEDDLAKSLNNLALRLGEFDRTEEALDAVREAVAIRRRLVARRPEQYLQALSANLGNLSTRLVAEGRDEEALAAVEEAVEIRRRLAESVPDAALPALAFSLNNLAVRLGTMDRREEALAAITEAVAIRRRLAAVRPVVHEPHLATSLSNLASRLSAVGRHEEAVAAVGEAVLIRRRLAAHQPAMFTRALAKALRKQARHLAALGRDEEARAAVAEEAGLGR